MSTDLFRLYNRIILGHPWLWVVLMVWLALLAALQARYFKLDASADSLVLENDAALRYHRAINKIYGTKDYLIITYTPQGGLLSEASVAHLRALQNDLLQLERITSVVSILDVPLLNSPRITLRQLGDKRTLSTPGVDKQLAYREFIDSPIYRKLLVSPDGNTTVLLAYFKRDEHYFSLLERRNALRDKRRELGHLTDAEAQALHAVSQEYKQYLATFLATQSADVAQVRAILERYQDGAQIFLGGVPMITSDMIDFIARDISTFGIAVSCLIVLVMWLFFRKVRWVLLPLLCCGISLCLVVGTLSWLDWRVTVISSNFISILIIITISLTIHLIVRYGELYADDARTDQATLVRTTVQLMFQPCLYTTITTIVAFISLLVSGIRPVIDFGWIMTLGITLAFIVSFIFFPSLLTRLRPKPSISAQDSTKRLTNAIAVFALGHSGAILTVFVVLTLLSMVGIWQLRVDNRFIDYFKKTTEIYQGLRVIDTQLGGTTPLSIVINADPKFYQYLETMKAEKDKDPFKDPFKQEGEDDDTYWFHPGELLVVEKIHDYLEALPQIGKVLSLGTTLKVIRFLNNDRVPDDYDLAIYRKVIPADVREEFLDPYMSPDGNQIRITMRIEETDPTLNRGELIEQIKRFLVDEMQIAESRIHFTGMAVLYNNMLHSLYRSQILTLGLVFLVILGMFVVLFRHLYIALLATLPNIFSAVTVLGIMGWLDIPLDMMTITIAAITIGIAVDDTIHYIHRFRHEFPLDADYRQTVIRCHGSIGRAMYYTSITITVGFSILTLSNFIPTIYFGLLTGLAMILALLGDLILLPLLLVICKPLGTEPAREASFGSTNVRQQAKRDKRLKR